LDIDDFKQANDQYGYAAGDEVLQVGRILQRTFQSLEVVGRWGDAEFVVGMYGMSKDDAGGWLRLEILRQQVFTGSNRTKFQLTFSIGIAQYPEMASTSKLVQSCGHTAAEQGDW